MNLVKHDEGFQRSSFRHQRSRCYSFSANVDFHPHVEGCRQLLSRRLIDTVRTYGWCWLSHCWDVSADFSLKTALIASLIQVTCWWIQNISPISTAFTTRGNWHTTSCDLTSGVMSYAQRMTAFWEWPTWSRPSGAWSSIQWAGAKDLNLTKSPRQNNQIGLQQAFTTRRKCVLRAEREALRLNCQG